jgi:hypothetical protein
MPPVDGASNRRVKKPETPMTLASPFDRSRGFVPTETFATMILFGQVSCATAVTDSGHPHSLTKTQCSKKGKLPRSRGCRDANQSLSNHRRAGLVQPSAKAALRYGRDGVRSVSRTGSRPPDVARSGTLAT